MPKTGGRKKGTSNRRTGILVEELHELGFHPAAELVKLFSKLEPEAQAKAIIALMGFLYPKKAPGQAVSLEEQRAIWRIRDEWDEQETASLSDEEVDS
jgi:hypothetical protein